MNAPVLTTVDVAAVFDPILYIAEMRQAGATVAPTLSMSLHGCPRPARRLRHRRTPPAA